jgi:hypothetical protein
MTKQNSLPNMLREVERIFTQQFDVPRGCSEGDSAINEVADQSIEATRAVAEETGCSAWTGDHCEAEHRSLSDPIERRPCSCRKAAERVLKGK